MRRGLVEIVVSGATRLVPVADMPDGGREERDLVSQGMVVLVGRRPDGDGVVPKRVEAPAQLLQGRLAIVARDRAALDDDKAARQLGAGLPEDGHDPGAPRHLRQGGDLSTLRRAVQGDRIEAHVAQRPDGLGQGEIARTSVGRDGQHAKKISDR